MVGPLQKKKCALIRKMNILLKTIELGDSFKMVELNIGQKLTEVKEKELNFVKTINKCCLQIKKKIAVESSKQKKKNLEKNRNERRYKWKY